MDWPKFKYDVNAVVRLNIPAVWGSVHFPLIEEYVKENNKDDEPVSEYLLNNIKDVLSAIGVGVIEDIVTGSSMEIIKRIVKDFEEYLNSKI